MAVSRLPCNMGQSAQSSVVLNESYCEPDLVIANHHSSYQEERIVSLPKEGKNICQNVMIVELQRRRTSRATARKWVKRVSLFLLRLYGDFDSS